MTQERPVWTRWGAYRRSQRFPLRKRLMDLVLLIAAAPAWVPILVLVAVVVRLRIGSPVLFRQNRPGLNGEIYPMIKFRSMTEERGPDGALLPDAQRLGPFGRWLRSTSLDELPELLNVLRGEMSLVGPRPLLVQYLERYSPEQRRRQDLPPGITGWAQINGRNALAWPEKFACDVWYIDHAGLGLDLWILMRTLWTVVRRDGISAAGDATMPEFRGN